MKFASTLTNTSINKKEFNQNIITLYSTTLSILHAP